MILGMENVILGEGVVERVAAATTARRGADYTDEVRRLLTAALEVMRRCGTTSRPRVADIVAAAGLSNDAFYRHFRSKEALVEALIEDGTERLRGYLSHQMAKETDPAAQVRRWIDGVMAQAEPEVAATTLAVLSNGSSSPNAAGRHFASAPLAPLLSAPFAALGSPDPDFAASLAAHAVLGKLSEYLWQQTAATVEQREAMARFCIAAAKVAP